MYSLTNTDLFSVKGKVVLITGSTRGLGRVFAKGFAEAGAVVIINGRNAASVASAAEEFRCDGLSAFGYSFDVSDETAVHNNIAQIESEVGPIDVLINNAGIQRRNLLENMTSEEWNDVLNTNLSAAFLVSKAVVPSMIKRQSGKIIHITSLMSEGARPTTGNYAAAKGGLKMLMKAMAAEWGRYNIQVNAIGPGYFKTDMNLKLFEDPQFNEWVTKKVPLGRWGNPEELVGAAIFLASDASNYVNGQTIYVDGGWQAAL